MSRWLVTAIPAWLLLVGLVIVVAGGAVLAQTVIRRRLPGLAAGDHNDVTKFTYGFIGFIYAFFIGFVVSSMWGQTNSADANARAEGAVGVQMARAADVFDAADRGRIRASLLAYESAAIAEWPTAQVPSPSADAALAALYGTYRQVLASTDVQKAVLATSTSNLDQISQARTIRVLTAREDTGPPWPIWAVIFLSSAMVLGTVVIYGVERAAQHYPMVAIVGVIVAANFFLILSLSHPFVGAVATSSDPLSEVVSVLSRG
ncbi:DUF4239 domain-containing protein [Mycolicibacterium sediminis]|uniref:DUF4239 domain-containing protein n=1 Tax=Mycolicibacterium sediminis TaxID=1286180 RepID=A0A7I7QRK2_9MYCO|nr:DUF4239 domain-containing protein [Mycolicibacterium sediminis]BBY28905.1 hypothetical protein MSEDJ_30010 [Mycolicibacterium sediminis]